jgi:hypothetical protein
MLQLILAQKLPGPEKPDTQEPHKTLLEPSDIVDRRPSGISKAEEDRLA